MSWETLKKEIDSLGLLKANEFGFYNFCAEEIEFSIGYNPIENKIVLQYSCITARKVVEPTEILFNPEDISQQKIFIEVEKLCKNKQL